MTSKQDRQGVRTAADLEQKYHFGRMFQKLEEGIKAVAAKATEGIAQLKAYADGKFLGRMRLLTSADDCNNIKDDGVYWYSTASVPKNAPFANAAIIEVYGADNKTSQKIQRATRYGAGGYSATRALYNNNWCEWYHYALTTDGVIPISMGGTGATTAEDARTNLGAAPVSHNHSASQITSGTLPVARGGTGGKTVAEAQSALHVTQDYLFSQLNSAGDKSLSGIDVYPTRPGVFRVTTGSAAMGIPGNYGCLVIFNGGGYYMNLYVNSDGFWVARTTSATAPSAWKKMATA